MRRKEVSLATRLLRSPQAVSQAVLLAATAVALLVLFWSSSALFVTKTSKIAGQRIIIVGGGPTGLGAAWRLNEIQHDDWILLERNASIGGLSASVRDDAGFTWDLGGHVYFSHYEYFTRLFDALVPRYQENDREAWVRINGTWVPYPFQNNLRYLPRAEAQRCLSALEQAQARGDALLARNFGQFVDSAFGERIAQIFMRPYNYKVWAHPVEMLNKEWIGERVAVIDVERARQNVLHNQDDFGWGPNSRFKYAYHGTQELFDRMVERLPRAKLRTSADVRRINVRERTVELASGETLRYDRLLNTMPLDWLVSRVLRGPMPDAVRWSASTLLRHSGAFIVGIGVRARVPKSWSWMYFPESNTPFYRVTYLSNYSPLMAPDGHYSMMAEISFSSHKLENESSVIARTIDGLVAADVMPAAHRPLIVSKWLRRLDYAYPTPSVERDAALSLVLPWLDARHIRSRGRFGLWRYETANTDHTTMQGVEAVNNWAFDDEEVTMKTVYKAS